MKKIGIILATQEEFEEVIKIMKNIEEKRIGNVSFIEGKIEYKNCVIVESGVGKVNAARVTQMMIDYFKIEFIINLGAAGALNPTLQIGDIVIGENLVQHDFDITAFGHSKGYITGVGEKVYSDENLINIIKKSIKNIDEKIYKVKIGTIASGDIFCTSVQMKDKIYAKFDAQCVEMEGAAIAQVSFLNNIPFIVVRSISDTPNGNNADTYDQFVEFASKRCAKILKEFIKELG